MTPYRALQQLCGLTQSDAAALHGVRIDTVKSWSAGRNRAPMGVMNELRQLVRWQQNTAHDELLRAQIAAHLNESWPDEWKIEATPTCPSEGARAAVIARVIAGFPDDHEVTVTW